MLGCSAVMRALLCHWVWLCVLSSPLPVLEVDWLLRHQSHTKSSSSLTHLREARIYSAGIPRWLSSIRIHWPVQEMLETWVQSLGREDPLQKEMATHSSILAWRIPWTVSLVGYSPWGDKESDMTKWMSTHTAHNSNIYAESHMIDLKG